MRTWRFAGKSGFRRRWGGSQVTVKQGVKDTVLGTDWALGGVDSPIAELT